MSRDKKENGSKQRTPAGSTKLKVVKKHSVNYKKSEISSTNTKIQFNFDRFKGKTISKINPTKKLQKRIKILLYINKQEY